VSLKCDNETMSDGLESRISIDELDDLIAAVIDEARRELASDHWVLLRRSTTQVAAASAAGLAHCCQLAEELVAAHRRGSEIAGRILSRALFETWIVAYYIRLGGQEALNEVAADSVHRQKQHAESFKTYDRLIADRRSKVRRKNRKIVARNDGCRIWNSRNPDLPPKEMIPLLKEPEKLQSGVDTKSWLASFPDVDAKRLSLVDVIHRLGPLMKAYGVDETYELAYHFAYRAWSASAHPTMSVLDRYLDDRQGMALFLRVKVQPHYGVSFADPDRQVALMLLSGLAVAVFTSRSRPCPVAQRTLDRIHGKES
jgi:hypothetical protein